MREVYNVAIRVAFDRAVDIVDSSFAFVLELDSIRRGAREIDAELVALDALVAVPASVDIRPATTSAAITGRSVDDVLDELNERARKVLDAPRHPAPVYCPEPGQWVRAMSYDDDLRGAPLSPWHKVRGWDAQLVSLRLRCTSRARNVNAAVRGDTLGFRALVVDVAPSLDVCRKCTTLSARDAT